MLLSNRLGLHIGSILQNASALPAYCYTSSKRYGLLKPLQPTTGHINADLQLHYDHPSSLQDHPLHREAGKRKPQPSTDLYQALASRALAKQKNTQNSLKPQKRYWKAESAPSLPSPQGKPMQHNNNPAPLTATVTKPAKLSPPQPAQVSRSHWKPGRGLIEKVDRLTGEVFHLVEN